MGPSRTLFPPQGPAKARNLSRERELGYTAVGPKVICRSIWSPRYALAVLRVRGFLQRLTGHTVACAARGTLLRIPPLTGDRLVVVGLDDLDACRLGVGGNGGALALVAVLGPNGRMPHAASLFATYFRRRNGPIRPLASRGCA